MAGALAVLALVVGLALPLPASARSFAIERFAVDLDVQPDSSLTVREALTIRFHGRHQGLFRLIPVRYVRHGLEHVLRLEDIHVLDEAHTSLRTEVTYRGRYVRIAAWVPGAADATRTVRIHYRVRRGLLAFEDHDELYWNVTGDEWDAAIEEARAQVTLPPGVPPSGVQVVAYTGPGGAAGIDWEPERGNGRVTVRTTRPLGPRQGLTIVVGWPTGAVARPNGWQMAWWLAVDHWPLALPMLIVVLMGLVWRTHGRDPAQGRSIKPEYAPPAGVMPAEGGTLIDEKADTSDVLATLIDLAVRGYLAIEPADGNDYRLRRLRPLDGDRGLVPLERFVLQKVFGEQLSLRERRLSELRRDSQYVFAPIRDAIYRAMVADRYFPRSPFWVRQGWGWAGLALLAAGGVLFVQLERLAQGWPLPAGIAASGLAVLAFTRAMPRRTWRGARLLVHLRGFQEFLERAERDRLERLPADTLHRWLPWAIALGVAEQWIHRFEGMTIEAPAWLGLRDPFDLRGYERRLEAFGRRTTEALLSGRRGGGGGGRSGLSGGASGRGFGGGGGGTF